MNPPIVNGTSNGAFMRQTPITLKNTSDIIDPKTTITKQIGCDITVVDSPALVSLPIQRPYTNPITNITTCVANGNQSLGTEHNYHLQPAAGCSVADGFFGWAYQLVYQKFVDPKTGAKKYHEVRDNIGCLTSYTLDDPKYFEGYQLHHGELERTVFPFSQLGSFSGDIATIPQDSFKDTITSRYSAGGR